MIGSFFFFVVGGGRARCHAYHNFGFYQFYPCSLNEIIDEVLS